MKSNIHKLNAVALPDRLKNIPSPPKQLFTDGETLENLLKSPVVAIVGSRGLSAYGREVTTHFAEELARRGVIIVSGLALGVDSVAHKGALTAGGKTIAVLPSPIEKIYPASHGGLAREIVENGGALVSEYEAGSEMFKLNFIARNRLVSGLCDALLITEAAEKSGSLHTARFALSQGKDVIAVPGNITSKTSAGTNNLIKAGAATATDFTDVLNLLNLPIDIKNKAGQGSNPEEQALLDLLGQGTRDGEELLVKSQMDIALFNQTLTMLEITGKIRALGANQWTVG